MAKKMHTIHNLETGEITTVELTEEEIASYDKPYIPDPSMESAIYANLEAQAEKKAAALAKLSKIGLTPDDIKAILS